MKMIRSARSVSLLLAVMVVFSHGFCNRPSLGLPVEAPPVAESRRARCSSIVMPSSREGEQDPKRAQEVLMEEMSLRGVDRIRSLTISERTQRALLAETIEDYIFELTEELETVVNSGDQEYAVELVKQIKPLQTQYQELVTGEPSSLLQTLQQTGKDSSNDEQESSSS